jgi:chromate transporter
MSTSSGARIAAVPVQGDEMDEQSKSLPPGPSPFTLFSVFFGISALTIGGGYAMIPVFADRITKRKWMEEKDFYDLFSAGQAFPGPMALNTAMLVGAKLAGKTGAAASFLGIVLPPFFSIILVSLVFTGISSYPAVLGFLEGSYAVVLGLVAAMLYKMLSARAWKPAALALSAAGTLLLLLAKGYAMPVFLAVVLVAYIGGREWNW